MLASAAYFLWDAELGTRRCCPTPVEGCWGARHESQPKKDLQRGCRAWSAALPEVSAAGARLPPVPKLGGVLSPPRSAAMPGAGGRCCALRAGLSSPNREESDGFFCSLPALPVQQAGSRVEDALGSPGCTEPAREVERVPQPYCPGDGIWGLARCPQQAAGCLGVPGWAEGCRGPAGQEGRVERWEPSAQQPLG